MVRGRSGLLLPAFMKWAFSEAARWHLLQKSQYIYFQIDLFSSANSLSVFGFLPVTVKTTSLSFSSDPFLMGVSMLASTWAYSSPIPLFLTWCSANSSTVRLT